MKTVRPAFTIIEILISVIILSFAIIFVLQVHTDSREQIIYISERNTLTLEDSLYLGLNILRYHKDTKSAHDIIQQFFRVREQEGRSILKENKRDIFIPDEITIFPPEDIQAPTAIVNKIMLKGKHSAIYYRFRLQ